MRPTARRLVHRPDQSEAHPPRDVSAFAVVLGDWKLDLVGTSTEPFWQACHGGQLRMAKDFRALGANLKGTPF